MTDSDISTEWYVLEPLVRYNIDDEREALDTVIAEWTEVRCTCACYKLRTATVSCVRCGFGG